MFFKELPHYLWAISIIFPIISADYDPEHLGSSLENVAGKKENTTHTKSHVMY